MLGGPPRPQAPNLPRPAWKRLWCRLYDCGNSPAPARRKTSPDLLPRARRLVRLELCRNSGHQVSVQIPPPQRELSAGGYCDTGFGIWSFDTPWAAVNPETAETSVTVATSWLRPFPRLAAQTRTSPCPYHPLPGTRGMAGRLWK